MRTLLFTGFFFLFSLVINTHTQAQILKRLQQKAEQAVERAVERKVDQELEKAADRMVDRTWESLFGGFEGGSGAGIFQMGENVKTADSYTFHTIAHMKIETFASDGKAEDPFFMSMHFSDENLYTGTKIESTEMKKEVGGEVFIIYDLPNESMIMLMGTEEGKFSFAYGFEGAADYLSEDTANEMDWEEVETWNNFKHIGTKSINSFSCEGYVDESDEMRTEIWVNRDESYGFANMMGVNTNTKQLKGRVPSDYPHGMLVQSIYEDKHSSEKMIMTLERLEKNANLSFRMRDYPSLSFGAMQDK